jgi:RES domain-containing protein
VSVSAWRITKAKFAATAFTGEGSSRFPGRWNRRDEAMVYTAGSLSLAVLEMLVHLKQSDLLDRYVVFRVSIPTRLVHRPRKLPDGWAEGEIREQVRQFGSEWMASGRGCAMRVPSAIIPTEFNYLLNPCDSRFGQLVVSDPEPFEFDPRLLRLT